MKPRTANADILFVEGHITWILHFICDDFLTSLIRNFNVHYINITWLSHSSLFIAFLCCVGTTNLALVVTLTSAAPHFCLTNMYDKINSNSSSRTTLDHRTTSGISMVIVIQIGKVAVTCPFPLPPQALLLDFPIIYILFNCCMHIVYLYARVTLYSNIFNCTITK